MLSKTGQQQQGLNTHAFCYKSETCHYTVESASCRRSRAVPDLTPVTHPAPRLPPRSSAVRPTPVSQPACRAELPSALSPQPPGRAGAEEGAGAMRRLLSGCASPGGRGTALCLRGTRPARASPSRGRSPAPAAGGSERAELSRAERGNGRRGLAAGLGRSFAFPPLPIGRGAVRRSLPGAGSGRPAPRVPYGDGPGGPVPGVTAEELPAGGRGGGGAGAVQLDRPPAAGLWARVVASEKRPEQCGRGRAPPPPGWGRRSGLLSPGPSCGFGAPRRCGEHRSASGLSPPPAAPPRPSPDCPAFCGNPDSCPACRCGR